jgi:hypothetical protein
LIGVYSSITSSPLDVLQSYIRIIEHAGARRLAVPRAKEPTISGCRARNRAGPAISGDEEKENGDTPKPMRTMLGAVL